MKDDWFPDPLNFRDMIEGGILATQIVSNFEGNHGEYVPIKRSIYNLPKANFTLRYALKNRPLRSYPVSRLDFFPSTLLRQVNSMECFQPSL
jgi:hypothetical protein